MLTKKNIIIAAVALVGLFIVVQAVSYHNFYNMETDLDTTNGKTFMDYAPGAE